MIAAAAIALTYKGAIGNWFWWDGLLLCSFFLGRGLLEWVIHSWLYHANPIPLVGWRLISDTSRQHNEHHQNPADLSRLLITYKGVLALSSLVFVSTLLIFQSIDLAFTMTLGLIIVGFMIEVVHLICHCDIPHKSKTMKKLVWLHRHHHRKDQANFYGVSSSLGDKLFGSYPSGGKQ